MLPEPKRRTCLVVRGRPSSRQKRMSARGVIRRPRAIEESHYIPDDPMGGRCRWPYPRRQYPRLTPSMTLPVAHRRGAH